MSARHPGAQIDMQSGLPRNKFNMTYAASPIAGYHAPIPHMTIWERGSNNRSFPVSLRDQNCVSAGRKNNRVEILYRLSNGPFGGLRLGAGAMLNKRGKNKSPNTCLKPGSNQRPSDLQSDALTCIEARIAMSHSARLCGTAPETRWEHGFYSGHTVFYPIFQKFQL